MQFFVRTMEKHKTSTRVFSPEKPCAGLYAATNVAKQLVLASDPAIMLQADACFRNHAGIRTKYRCWRDEWGEFHEQRLV